MFLPDTVLAPSPDLLEKRKAFGISKCFSAGSAPSEKSNVYSYLKLVCQPLFFILFDFFYCFVHHFSAGYPVHLRSNILLLLLSWAGRNARFSFLLLPPFPLIERWFEITASILIDFDFFNRYRFFVSEQYYPCPITVTSYSLALSALVYNDIVRLNSVVLLSYSPFPTVPILPVT